MDTVVDPSDADLNTAATKLYDTLGDDMSQKVTLLALTSLFEDDDDDVYITDEDVKDDEEPASDAEFFEEDTEDVVEDTAEEVVESEPSESNNEFLSKEVQDHLVNGGNIELRDGRFVIVGEEE